MNLSFIKLDINIMNDSKIKIIRKMPDGDSLLILWIGLLCLGMKSGKPGCVELGEGIPFTDEMLACELDININTIRMGLETFIKLRMVEIFEDGTLFISNFEEHQELDKIKLAKQKTRLRVQEHRAKAKGLVCNDYNGVTEVLRNATDKEVDKDIESDKDKDKKKKKKHGEYNNVLLTDTDLNKLKERFTDWESRIKSMDEGIELKGYKYKSHYLAIIKWAEKDNKTIQSKSDKIDYTEGWDG